MAKPKEERLSTLRQISDLEQGLQALVKEQIRHRETISLAAKTLEALESSMAELKDKAKFNAINLRHMKSSTIFTVDLREFRHTTEFLTRLKESIERTAFEIAAVQGGRAAAHARLTEIDEEMATLVRRRNKFGVIVEFPGASDGK